jgi:ParB-like chromosome segregation protein Spo0J
MTTIKCLGETYEVAPAADLFDPMGKAELKELTDDIKKRGLILPITRDDQGKILAGRNRLVACHLAGVEPRFNKYADGDPVGFVIAENILRRHLTPKEKRALIEKLLKLDPEKSDRRIAADIKSSPTTVGTVRKEQEAAGDMSKLGTRKDTKGRQQPARRTTPPKPNRKSIQLAEAVPDPKQRMIEVSKAALREFSFAVDHWLPKMNVADLDKAKENFLFHHESNRLNAERRES